MKIEVEKQSQNQNPKTPLLMTKSWTYFLQSMQQTKKVPEHLQTSILHGPSRATGCTTDSPFQPGLTFSLPTKLRRMNKFF